MMDDLKKRRRKGMQRRGLGCVQKRETKTSDYRISFYAKPCNNHQEISFCYLLVFSNVLQ